jgi:phosphoglycerol transferase MdoB-like AlkP superfamily enzyme
VVSQIDILPTIAGMLHQSYVNTALGRDLLDPDKKNNYAFITNTSGAIGMVTDDYYFSRNINFPDEKLNPMHKELTPDKQKEDSARQKLSVFTNAFFETAKYLIMNNKKD